MSRNLKGRNKNRKIAEAAPGLPLPTENQMDHALAAFAEAKLRHPLIQLGDKFIVNVLPTAFAEMPLSAVTTRRFTDEASARQWREREIIREAITAGMRAKP